MRFVKGAWHKSVRFLVKGGQDSLPAYSAQAAFFVMLSFFPFMILIMLFLSKLTFVNVDIVSKIINFVPEELSKYVQYVIEDLHISAKYSFTIIAVIVCLWSAGKAIQALYNALNIIYGTNEKRKGFIGGRILCSIYTLIFIVAIILLMILDTFGHQVAEYAYQNWPMLYEVLAFFLGFKKFFSFALMFFFFLLIYYQLPERKGAFRHELIGALGATIAWSLVKSLFSMYIRYAAGGSYMYGSMSYIVMLLIWLYFGMQIILYGAELNWFMMPKLHKWELFFHEKFKVPYKKDEEYEKELIEIENKIKELDEMMEASKNNVFKKRFKKNTTEKTENTNTK